MDNVLSRMSESEKVDELLDYYLFEESAIEPVQIMESTLPFAELEVTVRGRIYAVSEYLERSEQAADIQVEQILKNGLALLAKTAVLNELPTDTVLYGQLDQAVYRECIARLEAQRARWQRDCPAAVLADTQQDRDQIITSSN